MSIVGTNDFFNKIEDNFYTNETLTTDLASPKLKAEFIGIFNYDYMLNRIFQNSTAYNLILNNSTARTIMFNSEVILKALGDNDIAMKVILNNSTAITYLESLSSVINSGSSTITDFRTFVNVINKSCFVLGLYSNVNNIKDIFIKGVNKEIYLQKNSLSLAYSRTNGFVGKMIKGLEVKTLSNVSSTIYAKVIQF